MGVILPDLMVPLFGVVVRAAVADLGSWTLLGSGMRTTVRISSWLLGMGNDGDAFLPLPMTPHGISYDGGDRHGGHSAAARCPSWRMRSRVPRPAGLGRSGGFAIIPPGGEVVDRLVMTDLVAKCFGEQVRRRFTTTSRAVGAEVASAPIRGIGVSAIGCT